MSVRLGVVIPACVQVDYLRTMTLSCIEKIETKVDTELFVAINRIKDNDKIKFRDEVKKSSKVKVAAIAYGDRSVCSSWNWGITRCQENEIDYVLLLNNDVVLFNDTIDKLVEYGDNNPDVAIWSGISINHVSKPEPGFVDDGTDFSCVMLRSSTIDKHGWFDENFKPAYHDDSDYAARLYLGGAKLSAIHDIKFIHGDIGGVSKTIKHDAEMNHHSSWWWPLHERYFKLKWGSPVLCGRQPILENYYKHPFNNNNKPLSWWEPNHIERI
jgi:hypothetical protein